MVLIDGSAPLQCFADDFWQTADALATSLGAARTEMWVLPHGPEATRWPAWEGMASHPWTPQTAVLLLTDLGAGRPAMAARWSTWLRQQRRQAGRLLAVVPCAVQDVLREVRRRVAVVPMVSQPVGDQGLQGMGHDAALHLLLAALAPALSVEPRLIRAMRLALLPASSPLLERDVWCHADLSGGLPFRQWRPDRQRHWLGVLAEQPLDCLRQVEQVLRHRHPHCNQAQRDEETLLLGALVFLQADAAEGETDAPWRDRYLAAQQRCSRVARHLLSLDQQTSGPGRGAQPKPAAHTAFSKAGERLRRMPVALRSAGVAGADERNAFDLFTVNVTNNKIVRLTQDTRSNEEPAFSPNGRLILFNSTRNGAKQLFVMTSDGQNQTALPMDKGEYTTPDWGP